MKKLLFFLSLICCLMSSGCGTKIEDSDYYANGIKIIEYLDTNNTQGLKDMFCPIIKDNIPELDEQIETAMEFYNGEMISYGSITGGEGETYDEGELVKKRISPRFHNVKTTTGDTYEILFYSWIANNSASNRMGISEIVITNENGEECVIGDYYLVNPEMK